MLNPQEETPAPVETAAGANRSRKPDPSVADRIQKEQRNGSWSDDDPGRPTWDRGTTLISTFDYNHADGTYAYSKFKGRRADGEKAFLTGRRFSGGMGNLSLELKDRQNDFYRFEGLEHVRKGKGEEPDLPYRLHEVTRKLAERPEERLIIAEGEKDADTLWDHGFIATTNPDGAMKWRSYFNVNFVGRNVVVIADNDDIGKQHAEAVAKSLRSVAGSVKIVDLPGLAKHGDFTDWIDAGHTRSEFLALINQTAARANRRNDSADTDLVSQVTMANEWAEQCGAGRRYEHTRGQWMRVDSAGIWRADECRATFNEIGGVVHEIGGGASRYSCSGFISGTENIARSLPAIAVTHKHFDTDKMLLGTPSGPVDLRTGKLHSPDPELLISKSTSVSPASGKPAKWLEFLMQSTGDDDLMVEYLQIVLGYMLTGLTIEQALFFIYGDGGNGKGVFINTARRIIGDYATTSAMETFTASRNDQHPTGLAMLNGARMVTASETEQGRPWAESRIKQLTGSDEISARYMRQDFFSFVPEFKLLIIGNFHPVLHTVDDAMKRRFNIIPFTRKPSAVNRKLEEELEPEFPQILRWMIDGCLKWQADGLPRPQAVAEATDDYFQDQDIFGQWLEEYCERGEAFNAVTNDLFHNWSLFADDAKEDAGSTKSFGGMMTKRGFAPGRHTGGQRLRYWKGLRLQTVVDPITGYESVKSPRNHGGRAM